MFLIWAALTFAVVILIAVVASILVALLTPDGERLG